MYASFAAVPNHSGAGSVSRTGSHMSAGGEEGHVLERVHRAVPNGRLVEEGQVPEVEARRPERERDRRVREHAQALHRAEREQWPEDRAGQPREQAERREV